ncbi:efflux RND transporter periplasmic adaptor subunit [Thalassovita taeanensis]|uniref:Membrane fusion protein, multidrug efflux system n=1 Tax=Thalassovita taeanensis TaxID=657014 RepID=A0A1H9HUS9_9RHOB|nr:efflux RND transporter periplasmic adaptor subunit [Thalassovita taeanensis]SEQ66080.1 membrane fusion protein, multidrug efflux system [Thalassovita taeanensis]
MKIVPILTAVLVSAVLYLLVMERDALMAFALSKDAPAEIDATTEEVAVAPEQALKPIGVVAVHSGAQAIDSAVVLRGETQAARAVEVRAETGAQVISEPLRKGSYVEAGQVLCQLDPGTRPASLATARAALAEAEARVPEAQARLKEAQARLDEAVINDTVASKLSKDGYAADTRVAATQAAARGAEAGVESARSGVQSAQAGIQSAEAAVASAETEMQRLTIKAPFGGLLESDAAELGSLLQSGGLCATVIQLDPIKLVGYVPETEVSRVSVGALAGARLATGAEVRGRVTFLSRSADPQTRTFRVDIDVPNADLNIRDGQTAEIMIASDGANAHLLPQSALTLDDDGRLGVRLVATGSVAQFAPVQLIRDTVKGVWVTGLDDQVDVIVVGQEYVTDGVAVVPTWQEEATQ